MLDSKVRKITLISLLCTPLLASCQQARGSQNFQTSENSVIVSDQNINLDSKNKKIQELIDNQDFIGLFKNAEKIGYHQGNAENNFIISDPVLSYLKAHAKNRDAILALLKTSNFKVYTGNTYIKNKKISPRPYDEEIYGEQSRVKIPFIGWVSYRIFIYMKDGSIDRVLAHTFLDSL